MEQQELNQLIQDYERLFHKVLQRCSLFPGQVDYEDHLQELRLLFFMRAKEYATKSEFEMANDITYLFRHLLWRMIDTKRKKYLEIEEVTDEILDYLPNEDSTDFHFESLDRLARFYQQLSPKDQQKCRALLTNENLSRQNKSRYRKYFRKHFQHSFEKV